MKGRYARTKALEVWEGRANPVGPRDWTASGRRGSVGVWAKKKDSVECGWLLFSSHARREEEDPVEREKRCVERGRYLRCGVLPVPVIIETFPECRAINNMYAEEPYSPGIHQTPIGAKHLYT